MTGAHGETRERLTVRLWRARYLVPSVYDDSQRVRDILDTALRTRLVAALEQRLPGLFDTGDGIVCIRHLELDLTVDVAEGVDAVADRCARTLAAALERSLAGQDDTIVRFRNPADRLARFVADAASGDAWGRWYYQPFEGLRTLPTSTALRSALEAEPSLGLSALHSLGAEDRDRVYATLTPADAGRLLECLSRIGPPGDDAQALRAILDVRSAHRMNVGDGIPILALRLFVSAAAHARPDGLLRAVALRVAQQSARLASHATTTNTLARLMRRDDACEPPGPDSRHHAVDALPDQDPRRAGPLSALPLPGEPEYTPFGGGFLLLGVLDAMPLEACTQNWPPCRGTAASAVLRLLMLAVAHGSARSAAVFADPLWRTLLAVDPRIAWTDLVPWLREVGTVGRRQMERSLADADLPPPVQLHLHTVRLGAHRYVLLVDDEQRWRSLAEVPTRSPGTLPGAAWRAMRRHTAAAAIHFGAHETFHAGDAAADDPTLAEEAGRATDTWGPDIEFLLGNWPDSAPSPAWRRVLALAAQRLLHGFARRLPGFASSHLSYLHTNFLHVAAAVESGPDRRLVRLGRPPLALMLNLAGLNRGRRELCWINGPALELFPGD